MTQSKSTIFESEFVSKFDPEKAMFGGKVDIRIVDEWCFKEGISVEDLKSMRFWSCFRKTVMRGACALSIVSTVVFLVLLIREGFPEPEKVPTHWWLVPAVFLGISFVSALGFEENATYWKFLSFLRVLRKQMQLGSKDRLDQDYVRHHGEIDIADCAVVLHMREVELKDYVYSVVDSKGKIDRRQLGERVEKGNAQSVKFTDTYKTYLRAYNVEEQGVYMARAQKKRIADQAE